jgi:hypothetical protein
MAPLFSLCSPACGAPLVGCDLVTFAWLRAA